MEYIFTFLISIFFAHVACKFQCKNHKFIFYILSLLSVLPPVVLAGARSRYVGTDTGNYYWAFERAIMSNSYQELLAKGSTMEFGFQFFTYLCSRITNNLFILMSLFHTMIILPIYIALIKWKDKISPAFGLFIFYFMFYCMTLNTTRQGVALSFSVLSISYLMKFESVNLKSILFGFIAISFHNSAYLLFFLYGLFLMTKYYSLKDHLFIYLISALIFILGIYVLVTYFNVISVIESEREVYSSYLNSDREGSVSKSSFLFYCLVNYLLYLIFVKEDNYFVNFFFLSSLLATVMVFFALYNPTFRRLGLFFSIFEVISVPLAFRTKIVSKKNISKKWRYLFTISVVIMWYFSIVIRGSHETYPYISNLFKY